jgi:hypothetical protein
MKRQVKKFSQFIRESREEEDFGPGVPGWSTEGYDEDEDWDEEERRERSIGTQTELRFPDEEFAALICLGTATDAIEMKWKQVYDALDDAKISTSGYYVISGGKMQRIKEKEQLWEKVHLIKQGKLKDNGEVYYVGAVSTWKTIRAHWPGDTGETVRNPLRMEDIENFANGWWADWCMSNDCKDPQIRVYDAVTNKKVATL